MKVNKSLIKKLAELSKLEFDDQSLNKIESDFKKMLSFVEKVSNIDTKDVQPLIYLNEEKNILRSDDYISNLDQKEALKNAPKKDSDYFKVPTVLKK